jgi:hypothetical protein
MKNLILALFLISSTQLVYGQSKKVRLLLEEIKSEWVVDDNNNVTYVKVIEVPSLNKAEIYNRALNYFVYNYNSGKSVIQTQDENLGRVVGKGFYNDVHIGQSILTTYIDCFHIVRVDAREGRARVVLSLTNYEKTLVGGDSGPTLISTDVNSEFPINPKGYSKTVMGKAFYKSHKSALQTLESIEKALKEGNTSIGIENDDW